MGSEPKAFVGVLLELDVRVGRYLSMDQRVAVAESVARAIQGLKLELEAFGVGLPGEVIEARQVFIGEDAGSPRGSYPHRY